MKASRAATAKPTTAPPPPTLAEVQQEQRVEHQRDAHVIQGFKVVCGVYGIVAHGQGPEEPGQGKGGQQHAVTPGQQPLRKANRGRGCDHHHQQQHEVRQQLRPRKARRPKVNGGQPPSQLGSPVGQHEWNGRHEDTKELLLQEAQPTHTVEEDVPLLVHSGPPEHGPD